jgi:hypothetical protein
MEMEAREQRDIWIGMVEVRPFDDSELLAGVSGAFVNVLTWAADSEEFRRKAGDLMDRLHLEVITVEDAEPLENRGPEEQLDEQIARIAADVRYNPSAILYSTFHTWRDRVQ